MQFDLLIKGGEVVDPGSGKQGRLDVAIKRNRIAAVDTNIPAESAVRVIDAAGQYVTPGLVDLHTHVYHNVTYWGIQADPVAARSGVTTWLDVGSAGAFNVQGFREFIVKPAEARLYALLNISTIGLTASSWELANLNYCDVDLCVKLTNLNRDLILGVKVRIDHNTTSGTGVEALRRGREAAEQLELPVMVHIGYGPPTVSEVLPFMRPGVSKIKAISVLGDLVAPWAWSYFQAMLVSERVTKTFHNGLYDRTVLIGNGFEIAGPWHDTLLAHHSAFPGCAHGLQVVTSQGFATQPWKSEFRNAEEDDEKLLIYNAKDTGATLANRPWIEIVIKQNKNEKTYEIDRKMSECATNMHLRGMPVDREVNTELLKTFSKNVAEARDAVDSVARNPEMREQIWHYLAFEQAKTKRKADLDDFEARYNARLQKIRDEDAKGKWRWKISGGKHVAALIQAMGVELKQVTASGNVSTKKDILEGLVDVQVVRDLLIYRENDKLLSTFIWQIFDREVEGKLVQTGYADANDRIHPIWNVHKISGRWASYEPVVSNVPKSKWKKQPDGTMKMIRPNLRRQIKVKPGRKLVGFDFAQLEARNLALISGDEFLMRVFAEGLDIHTECARIVFSGAGGTTPFDRLDQIVGVRIENGVEVVTACDYCKRTDFHHEKCKLAKMKKQLRDLTKQVEYGAFYGGSPETLWKVLLKEGFNVRLTDVVAAVGALMRKMTGIVRWQRETVAKASLPPYTIRDFILGRRRVFPMGQVDPNEALNFESQSTAAAIMDTGMYRMEQRIIDRGYKECFAIVQVHDAAAYECWAEDAEDVKADIIDCYTQEYSRDGRTIPYPVDARIGDSWDQL